MKMTGLRICATYVSGDSEAFEKSQLQSSVFFPKLINTRVSFEFKCGGVAPAKKMAGRQSQRDFAFCVLQV